MRYVSLLQPQHCCWHLADGDGDTQVQVEESSDEDTIRFDAAGNEIASIAAAGVTINNELAARFAEASGNGTNFIGLKAPSSVASECSIYTYLAQTVLQWTSTYY